MKHEIGQHASEHTQMEMKSARTGRKHYGPVSHCRKPRSGSTRTSPPHRPVMQGLAALVLLMFLSSGGIKAQEASSKSALDVADFGHEASETTHNMDAETSQIIEGKDDMQARQITTPESDSLGSMSFTMQCHPSKRTYLTLKVRSDSEGSNPLLFDGDELASSAKYMEWVFIDRLWAPLISVTAKYGEKHSDWVYFTSRLPKYMTEGKHSVDLRFVLPAGSEPSYPVYRAYTHTKPLFDLPAEENVSADYDFGTVGDPLDEEAYLNSLVVDINGGVRRLQQREQRLSPREAYSIALAYQHPDRFDAVDQEAILEGFKESLDYYSVKQTEATVERMFGPRKGRGNKPWHGHGTLAQAYSLLHDAFKEAGLLSETLPDHPESGITRREAYAGFFDAALAWRCQNRNIRFYNQSAIISNGLVRMSRALELLDPERAPDRATVDRWIDEATGLAPMSPHDEGPFHGDNSVARMLQGKSYSEESVPEHVRVKINRFLVEDGSYFMATEAGTPKERGRYAMSYGVVGLRHTAEMAHETGLKRVKDRVVDMVRARQAMTWWVRDAENGKRWAAAEGTFASRAKAHPGNRNGNTGYGKTPLLNWLAAPHEVTQRWAELLFEHGHEPNLWRLHQKILWVEAFRALKKQKPSDYVIPMDRERYVWSDEDLGYVTVIDGDTHMKMQIGYSPRLPGVTGIAKVHYHGPEGDRVLTTDIDRMDFPFAGQTWELPHRGPSWKYPWNLIGLEKQKVPWRDQPVRIMPAMAGKKLKLAAMPDGEPWPPGQGGLRTPDYRAAHGIPFRDFRTSLGLHYRQLQVGSYLIGMNSTGAEKRGFGTGKSYKMEVPGPAIDMRTGKTVSAGAVSIPARTTVVLKLK